MSADPDPAAAAGCANCQHLTAALRELDHRYSVLVEDSPVPITVHRDGRLVYVNPAALRMWGVDDASSLLGHDFREFVEAADLPLADARLEEVQRHGRAPQAVLRLRHPTDGRQIVLETHPRRVVFDGEPATLVTCHDVTERYRAEQMRLELQAELAQAQKMEAIGRLAGGVAHDFSNMLTVILACTELAQTSLPADHPVQRELAAAHEAATRSAEFARHLLAFSRKRSTAPRRLDLGATVQSSVKMLQRLVGEGVIFAVALPSDLWHVHMDPGQVDQVMANLAVNARDATGGHGHVRVMGRNVSLAVGEAPSALPHLRPGDYVELTFADDGSGMDEPTRARIFEPYFTTKPAGVGTGLGLSTVRDIVESLAGGIAVESELGHGTRFIIWLPRSGAPITGPVDGLAAGAALPGPTPSRELTVMVVEDDPAALESVATSLRQEGYSVVTAPSPTVAIEFFEALGRRIDLLLTDVVMPALDGDQLAQRLRSLSPGLRVVYMSGYPADLLTDRLTQGEGTAFLPKPFTPAMLAAQVRRMLGS